MATGLTAGLSTTQRYTVDRERTIDFMGDALRVYATPWMLRDIEQTCRQLLLPHLLDNEDSVGAHVELDHLGPTLLGGWIEVNAKVLAVEGPRITFEVEVRDALDVVGRAKHVRFVIDKTKQKQRLEARAAKAKAAS